MNDILSKFEKLLDTKKFIKVKRCYFTVDRIDNNKNHRKINFEDVILIKSSEVRIASIKTLEEIIYTGSYIDENCEKISSLETINIEFVGSRYDIQCILTE